MRKELELVEKIEAYLEGRLSPEETRQFETQLADDTGLQQQVQLQRQLMMGVDRAGLKEQVRMAKRNYMFRRNIFRWGLGGLITAALVASLLYYKHHPAPPNTGTPTEHYQDARLPDQAFSINPDSDTVIATPKGIVMSIPAHAFLDEHDRPVTGDVQVIVKEALDPSGIMKAGLSTYSGQQLLSTGGMFFLDAKQGGHNLHIDTTHPILTQIPAASVKTGMQLYKGRRKADGAIDWTDPRPLEHSLVPVNIMTLDFYPPNYLDSLRQWEYDANDRRFTDSLYYSLAAYTPNERYTGRINSDTSFSFTERALGPLNCGLDPAKIMTIKSPQFQNTILATREFEERMHWLHKLGSSKLLDLYIDHLDWPLYRIDSLVATSSGKAASIFKAFAARHDGKANNTSPQLKKLSAFYRTQSKAYTDAIAKTQREYGERRRRLDSVAYSKIEDHAIDTAKHSLQNFQQEFEINLKEACRQLGINETIKPPAATYTASITSTGWYNIDQAAFQSTETRTTLNYTDTSTGKTATIEYTPATFQIDEWNTYDRVNVYLLPDKLSSFMFVNGVRDVYTEELNELLKYDLVCIGYKGDKTFYFHRSDIKAASYSNIRLQPISDEELSRQLNAISSLTQATELGKESSFYKFEVADQKRREVDDNLIMLRVRLLLALFPCITYGEERPY